MTRYYCDICGNEVKGFWKDLKFVLPDGTEPKILTGSTGLVVTGSTKRCLCEKCANKIADFCYKLTTLE